MSQADGTMRNIINFWLVSISDIVGVMKFGRDWKRMEKLIPSRKGCQIRSHAQKYFMKFFREQKMRKAKTLEMIKNET